MVQRRYLFSPLTSVYVILYNGATTASMSTQHVLTHSLTVSAGNFLIGIKLLILCLIACYTSNENHTPRPITSVS